MMAPPVGFLFLLAAVNLEALAQLFFKRATQHDQQGSSDAVALWHTIHSPSILLGIGAYIANMAFYTVALQTVDLSIAFPVEGLALIIVTLLSRVFLKEVITPRRWGGILLIVVGGILVSAG